MKPNTPLPPSVYRTSTLLTAFAAASLLSGCLQTTGLFSTKQAAEPKVEPKVAEKPAEPPQPDLTIPKPQEKPKPGKLYEWNGNGRSVSRVVVSIDEQRARFYDGNEQIGWSTIASGVPKHATPIGHFDILEKVQNKKSNLYGKIYSKNGKVTKSNAKMGKDKIPAGGRFDGAKMPYFLRLTYDGIGLHAGPIPRPGKPASHGCIRMPKQLAPILYKHITTGTQVTIHGKGPDYGNYAERQRIARAKQQLAKELRAEEEAAAKAVETVTGTAQATMPSSEDHPISQPGIIARSSATAEALPMKTESGSNPLEAESTPTEVKTTPVEGKPASGDLETTPVETTTRPPETETRPAEAEPQPGPVEVTEPTTAPETPPAQPPAASAA